MTTIGKSIKNGFSPMKHLHQTDLDISQFIKQELLRQQDGLEMIASENYASAAVMEAQGSVLTNKYAEGYPSKRYYGGCEFVDKVEQMAIDRVKQLFKVSFANVQPHSGSQANMAVFLTEMKPGEKLMGLDLSHGGHLTHGSSVNFSGFLFQPVFYHLHPETEQLDFNLIEHLAQKEKPKVLIAGYSAYPRTIDFKAFREVADRVGATLVVDMAHIAGLVAAEAHPSPASWAHYITSTTHKTLRGPRGGIILCNEEKKGKKINSRIFPGIQGGPLEHVIAAKAVAFKEALQPDFKVYAEQIIKNAKTLANTLLEKDFKLVTGGTDNHLILMDLSQRTLTGKEAEETLAKAGITVNKNTVPSETRSPFVTSGIRIGTSALTTRGMKETEMKQIGEWISQVLNNPSQESFLLKIKSQVQELCKKFPIYEDLH